MDDHIRFDLRLLHDADYCTGYVPDCRKIEAPDAEALWRQMDFYVRHSSFNIRIPAIGIRNYVQA